MRWEVFLFEFKKHTYEVSFKMIMYWKLIYKLLYQYIYTNLYYCVILILLFFEPNNSLVIILTIIELRINTIPIMTHV